MGFWEQFPYTNFHHINLDWILKVVKSIRDETTVLRSKVDDVSRKTDELYVAAEKQVDEYLKNLDIADKIIESGLLETVIGNLSAAHSTNFKNDKFLIVGDSLALVSDRGASWASYLKQWLNLKDGVNCVDISAGGHGFVGTSGSWLSALDTKYDSRVPKDQITKIVIMGGGNDRTAGQADLRSAMLVFSERVSQDFPNAHIYLACVANATDSTRRGAIRNSYEVYSSCADLENWTYISGMEGYLHCADHVVEDGHHANAKGSFLLASGLIQALNGLPVSELFQTCTLTPAEGVNSSGNIFRFTIRGLYAKLSYRVSLSFTFENPISISTSETLLGTFNNLPYFYPQTGTARLAIPCACEDSDGVLTVCKLYFNFNIDGTLTFAPRIVPSSMTYAGRDFKIISPLINNVEQFIYD